VEFLLIGNVRSRENSGHDLRKNRKKSNHRVESTSKANPARIGRKILVTESWGRIQKGTTSSLTAERVENQTRPEDEQKSKRSGVAKKGAGLAKREPSPTPAKLGKLKVTVGDNSRNLNVRKVRKGNQGGGERTFVRGAKKNFRTSGRGSKGRWNS